MEENLDIICITETWISENILNDDISEYLLDGYQLYSYERVNRLGGGVLLYIRSTYCSSLQEDIKESKDVESIWVKVIDGKGKSKLFGAFYRPPNCDYDVDLKICQEIHMGCSKNKETFILGDFNLPNIDWDTTVGYDRISSLYIDCFLDNFLCQNVLVPTRQNNILDLILSNQPLIVEVGESLGESDHNIIRFSINIVENHSDNTVKTFNFAKANFNLIREMLEQINWDSVFVNKSVFEMWDIFKNQIKIIQEQCIPLKPIRKYKSIKPPWFDREIRNLIKNKKLAHQESKRLGSERSLSKYREIRVNLKKLIRRKKRQAEINLARTCNRDPKKFFSFYKFNKKCDRVGPLESNGVVIDKDEEIVEKLNNYFSSVFVQEGNFNFSNFLPTCEMNGSVNITPAEVRNIIKKFNVNKACGPDGIHSKFLNETADLISVPLSLIFSKSLEYCEIPEDWKLANVVPIFKKGSKKDVCNYRPVSLTSLVCKVLEKWIKVQIEKHITQFNLIKNSQHGFRKGKSCLTNLLSFLDFITDKLDNGENIDVIYLDFSKAFDKVPHKRLISKLQSFGISENFRNWISNWLSFRKQRVVLNGKKSSWRDVLSGVPQGSVLGPLLFIMYVNDLEDGVISRIWKFADDTKVATSVSKISGSISLQNDLDQLLGWADKWKMSFNTDKCKVMHLGIHNNKFGYLINDSWLNVTEEEGDLGIIMSSDVKFHKQCLQARNKANKMLGIINRNVSYKSKEVITKLYSSYVRPHIEYCAQAWSQHSVGDLDLLESVQRRATRLIPSLEGMSYEERLKELNMFSVRRRFLRGDLIHVFKLFNNSGELDWGEFFVLNTDDRMRGHNKKIKKQQCHLNVRKNFFSHRVVNFWNSLPADIVNSDNLNVFKAKLDNHMGSLDIV